MDNFEQLAAERVKSWPEIDHEAFSASFHLFRLATLFLSRLESAVHRPAGVSIAGFRVLFTVWIYGELEPRQIARLSGVSTAAVSGVVSTLAAKGLVNKDRDPDDGRLVQITLTQAGTALLAEVYAKQNLEEQQMFSVLEPGELQHLTSTLRKLVRRLS